MSNKFKKAIASLMAIASLSTCAMGISANATSSFNYINNFSVDTASGSYRNLPGPYPHKDSTSPVYVYLTSASVSVNTRVMGCSGTYSVGGNCTCDASGNSIDSVQVSVSSAKNIYNNVRDNYDYCTLAFRSSSSYSGTYITGNYVSY